MCLFDWWFFEHLHSPVITYLYEGKHQLLTPSSGPVHAGFIAQSCHHNLWCQFTSWSYTALYSRSLLLKALDTTELIDDVKKLQEKSKKYNPNNNLAESNKSRNNVWQFVNTKLKAICHKVSSFDYFVSQSGSVSLVKKDSDPSVMFPLICTLAKGRWAQRLLPGVVNHRGGFCVPFIFAAQQNVFH